ncbi:hypothetical protein [Nostoc sp.]|uniref:hypothetical protein n=1 Tax=Nostoc sp. TaxID=1180 RepID=UPI002FF9DB82
MNWVKVDNIVLTENWQLLTSLPVDGSLFRITQDWDIYPQGAKALISQSLAETQFEFYGTQSFYPSDNIKILNMKIPSEFVNAGITTRHLVLKFHSQRKFTFNWNITIEKFVA